MGFSPYLQNKVMEHLRGITPYAAPASTFFALFIGDPLDMGTEVVAADYDRVEVDNDSGEWDVNANEAENLNVIQFTASPANDWTTGTDPEDAITHLVEFDAGSGGNMLQISELTVPLFVVTGGPPVEIPVGTYLQGIESIDS
jgi:hypothetical protein